MSFEPETSQKLEQDALRAGGAQTLEDSLDLLEVILPHYKQVFLLLDRSDRIRGESSAWMHDVALRLRRSNGILKVMLFASSNGNDDRGGKLSPAVLADLRDTLGRRAHVLEWDQ